MNLFNIAVDALKLENEHRSAESYFNNTENLQKVLANMGIDGLLDDGNVLDSSLQNPCRFMKITDSLMDYVNNNLDTLDHADDLLRVLLETEIVAADCFVPKLSVNPSSAPNHVDVKYSGVGLSLSFFGSESHLEITRETLIDDIMDEETEVVFKGRLTLYDDATIHWAAYVDTPTSEPVDEPEIPERNHDIISRETIRIEHT